MNPFRLVIKELLYRRISSLVILLTVVVASSVSVAIYTLSKASENETRKIMREQGLNLYIFPKGTNLIDFYSVNNTGTFPETYVDVLAESKTFDAVRHLTGILQIKYPDGKTPTDLCTRSCCSDIKTKPSRNTSPGRKSWDLM